MITESIYSLAREVAMEVDRAETLHPTVNHGVPCGSSPTNTPHGGYAVILEELEEFWEEVKMFNLPKGRDTRSKMREELIHVAAMCLRTIRDCEL